MINAFTGDSNPDNKFFGNFPYRESASTKALTSVHSIASAGFSGQYVMMAYDVGGFLELGRHTMYSSADHPGVFMNFAMSPFALVGGHLNVEGPAQCSTSFFVR